MKILGPCTVIQAALPAIFDKVPHSFHEKNIEVFRRNAELIYKGLSQVPGLNPIMPAGAMYIMVGIDIGHFPLFKDDIDFTKHLVIEQSVFCLPGTVSLTATHSFVSVKQQMTLKHYSQVENEMPFL
jgi:tyrosine aminotransferase